MKKKILLTLAITAMLIFVFTVAVSATTYIYVDETTNEELFTYEIASGNYPITSYSGKGFAKYDSEGDALTWYYTGSSTLETGEKQYTVTSAKTKALVIDDGDGILNSNEIDNYSKLVSITFDENCGITEFGTNSADSGLFHKTANQEFFLFANVPDSVTKFSNNCFRNCTSLIAIGISENSKLTDFGSASFYGATSLRSIYIPKGVTTFKTEFVTDKYWEHGLFRNCQKLETITFAKDSRLEVLEKGTFNYCNSLKTVTLPNSVKTIQPRVFAHCPALEYVNFGGGLVEIVRIEGDADEYVSMFQYATNLKTVVLPATFKAENLADDLHTTFAIKGITVYYAGTEAEFIKLQNKFAKATVGSGNLGITKASYNYINPCEAFYGGNHNVETVIEYTNYFSAGSKFVGCTNEGCNVGETKEALPFFICHGYSIPEDDRSGIAIGYTVNNDAIKEYVSVTGKTLKYGAFAVLKDRLGDNDIFGSDGTVADGVVNAEITNYDFVAFELKIIGFTDEQKDTKIAIGAYVSVSDGKTTEYSYLQYGTPDTGEKYCFVSYNDIATLNNEKR